MPKIEIAVPDVAHVVVTGPMQCGNSLVLARLDRVLRGEFGPHTVCRDLAQERRRGCPDNTAYWALKMAAKTTRPLSETRAEERRGSQEGVSTRTFWCWAHQ